MDRLYVFHRSRYKVWMIVIALMLTVAFLGSLRSTILFDDLNQFATSQGMVAGGYAAAEGWQACFFNQAQKPLACWSVEYQNAPHAYIGNPFDLVAAFISASVQT